MEAVALRAVEKEAFSTRVDRRVRYWVDGLVIGSDVFVKTLVAKARGEWAVSKRRLTRAYTFALRVAVPLQKLRQRRGYET